MTKTPLITINDLSCRGLSTSSNVLASHQSFCRSLRQAYDSPPDTLCLKETHASSQQDVYERLNMQRQASESILASHCGLVSLNYNILIEPIFTSADDG
ncbi:hypothetical protein PS15p_210059 [Mucor circinelloides]